VVVPEFSVSEVIPPKRWYRQSTFEQVQNSEDTHVLASP